jgi:hypothetical protein
VRGEGCSKEVPSAVFDLVVIAVDRAKVMDVVTLDDVQKPAPAIAQGPAGIE